MKRHSDNLAKSRRFNVITFGAMSAMALVGCSTFTPDRPHTAPADKEALALESGYAPGILSPGYGPEEKEGPIARKGK